jgi:putative hydrolase of the HAD superfamily
MPRDMVVFVDADDTLWENYRWFRLVLDEWAAVVARHGVDPAEALATLHATEDRNIPVTGYGAAPFVRSVVEAFHLLVPRADTATRDDVAAFARRAEETIRSHPIELLPGVRDALPLLAARSRVVVLTKGQDDEQRGKLGRSGLERWVEGLVVVAEKDAAVYRAACGAWSVAPQCAWMVGNSVTRDVNPALAAGLRAVHVPHAAPWHRDEGALDARAVRVATFAAVPSVVDAS